MRFKQKMCLALATALPLIAMTTYRFTNPSTSVHACYYSPGNGDGWCGDGHDFGVQAGNSGIFVFCPDSDGNTNAGGPGTCAADGSQCVTCTYGN